MQTFLPLPSFAASAAVLDRQRLGKQRIEAKQILQTLTGQRTGWRNHPAVKMWAGYESALMLYGLAICCEWRRRGYRCQQFDWFVSRLCADSGMYEPPYWLHDHRLHASHRAALLAKDPEHYSQFGWTEEPMDLTQKPLAYWWPE